MPSLSSKDECPLTSVNLLQMDPVQKAVINHTFGVTLLPTKKQIISCSVCQLRFNSDVSDALCFFSKGARWSFKM